jgi:hypothetical protein
MGVITKIPPPLLSERNASHLPSGENSDCQSSRAESLVKFTGTSPWRNTYMFQSAPFRWLYAMVPSGAILGNSCWPEDKVICVAVSIALATDGCCCCEEMDRPPTVTTHSNTNILSHARRRILPLCFVNVQERGDWPQKGTKCTKALKFCAFCAFLWPRFTQTDRKFRSRR